MKKITLGIVVSVLMVCVGSAFADSAFWEHPYTLSSAIWSSSEVKTGYIAEYNADMAPYKYDYGYIWVTNTPEDKTKEAYKLAKSLIEKNVIEVKTVKEFIDLVETIRRVLEL